MLKLFRNKLFIGGLCLLLAAVLAFGLLPRLYREKASTTEIVTLRQTVEYGTVITEDKVKAVKKSEMEARKAAIRSEDMTQGVFVPVSVLPKIKPQKASLPIRPAV